MAAFDCLSERKGERDVWEIEMEERKDWMAFDQWGC